MVATFSPHRDGGGTLHLASPSGLHHVDASSAIRQLRRSLSRSPSKGSDFRFINRPQSPSPHNKPFNPSPLSPSRRASSTNLFLISTNHSTPSPLAVPHPPSSRIARPGMKRNATSLPTPRLRTSPKSPSKRVLLESTDQGNSAPVEIHLSSSSNDIPKIPLPSPPILMDTDEGSTTPVAEVSENSTTPYFSLAKRSSANLSSFTPSASPMKRTDGVMYLDQPHTESPANKRRSLHGLDFSIFDNESGSTTPPGSGSPTEETPSHVDNQDLNGVNASPVYFSPIPKRSSSLRKSTLQQRQTEKSIFARPRIPIDFCFEATTPVPSKNRFRQSLNDQPIPRDSPFSHQGSLPNASIHPMSFLGEPRHTAHPLSRTLTQSSSSSSMDDSPTHEPIKHPQKFERPTHTLDFSKSLPIGSARPAQGLTRESSISSDSSFSTPMNYKNVKPLPQAFMSTGLISKKNRDLDDPQVAAAAESKLMPDTPCKKPLNVMPVQPLYDDKIRSFRPSFGTPSTPFGISLSGAEPKTFGKGVGIFGSCFKQDASRRGSFASMDGDDSSSQALAQSPSNRHSTRFTFDSNHDFPPTPTKRLSPRDSDESGPRTRHRARTLESLPGTNALNCKSTPRRLSSPFNGEDSDSEMEDSPSANLSFRSSLNTSILSMPSLPRTSTVRRLDALPSVPTKEKRIPGPIKIVKFDPFNPTYTSIASPLHDKHQRATPQTPQDGIHPPDPSCLSISAQPQRPPLFRSSSSNAADRPPATPTANRESFSFSRRPSIPSNAFIAPDVDPSLTARFQKVELIGNGEFSKVYRVSSTPDTTLSSFTPFGKRSLSFTAPPDRVWAVKKAKNPYAGVKDRQRKLKEVEILKALSPSDHTITFHDNWEDRNYLYIQTEFCDEGSLDTFLSQIGTKGRLDDFRIWKILLELSLGLKHIHDSGYIHLDLKPANVLITFEGTLKIADFGMAAHWPAASGIEGEGDREYIGPEILMGRYDKPADIFALGLIIFETAGNVELPDNGASWQKLRSGDLSDVPSLTWSSGGTSSLDVDHSGASLPTSLTIDDLYDSDSDDELTPFKPARNRFHGMQKRTNSMMRSGELVHPPDFMIDSTHTQALDSIVRWMISPEPADRPVADQLIECMGVQWAQTRRRAGATVFEGIWGPADEVLAEDTEMMDA